MLSTKQYIGFVCCLMIILQYVDVCTMAAHSIQHSPLDSLDEPAECLIKHSKTLDQCQSPISAYADGDQRQFNPDMCCSLVQYKRCLEDMAKILCGDNATHLILEEKGILSQLDRCNGHENIAKSNKVKRYADIELKQIVEQIDCFAKHYQEFEECYQESGVYEIIHVPDDIKRFLCCPVTSWQRACYEFTARKLCSRGAAQMLKNGLGKLIYHLLNFLGKDCQYVNCR